MSISNIPANSKFRLFVKKLSSGKFQVKFKIVEGDKKGLYGYVLVHPGTTLKEVVKVIESRMLHFGSFDSFHHQHLYSLGKFEQVSMPLTVCRT